MHNSDLENGHKALLPIHLCITAASHHMFLQQSRRLLESEEVGYQQMNCCAPAPKSSQPWTSRIWKLYGSWSIVGHSNERAPTLIAGTSFSVHGVRTALLSSRLQTKIGVGAVSFNQLSGSTAGTSRTEPALTLAVVLLSWLCCSPGLDDSSIARMLKLSFQCDGLAGKQRDVIIGPDDWQDLVGSRAACNLSSHKESGD